MAQKVMAFGTFDIFHEGHQRYLSDARDLGTELIVVIARDKNVEKIKGRAPHFSETRRQREVIKSELADQVLLGDLKDKFRLIRELQPQVIALGFDQDAPLEELQQEFPQIKIIRLLSHFPQKFKSSLLRKKYE